MTLLKLLVFIFVNLSLVICSDTQTSITIFEVSTNLNYSTYDTIAGHLIAINEINNNPDILPNYTLNFQVYDAAGQSFQAIIETLSIIDFTSNETHIYFPLILGPSWSSLTVVMNPILGAFNKGQIGTGTSIDLSDTGKYPYFYRTIANDELQAEGIILLCKEFNWTSVAVVYVNDAYGVAFALKIFSFAEKYDIDATSIAVTYGGDQSYRDAASQIKQLGIYIIILIVHTEEIIFQIFQNESITGYPYYYLGVDAWFTTDDLNVMMDDINDAKGFVGTVPWQTNSLPLDLYDEELRDILNISLQKYHDIEEEWNNYRDAGHEYFVTETMLTLEVYAYDAMYTIAYLIEELGEELINFVVEENNEELIKRINEIVTKRMGFIGATGNVSFNENGDREYALYSLANVGLNGSIQYIGYLYQHKNGSVEYKIDQSLMIWPDYFTEKDMIPRVNKLIYTELQTLYLSESIAFIVLLSTSCAFTIFCMAFLIWHRNSLIIKAASWRLNIVMCSGAILMYTGGILYAIDEQFDMSPAEMDVICNVRLWLLATSVSLLYMPLFVKTYRLSRVFNTLLTKKKLTDAKIFMIVGISVLIDIILLSIFTAIQPQERGLFDYKSEDIDELQERQWKVGSCTYADYNWMLTLLLYFKITELLWGLHVALDVSRIEDVSNMLKRFDETGIQLFSIAITFVAMSIFMPILNFGPTQNPHFFGLMITITIVLLGNVTVFLNLGPRMYAVIVGNEEKYGISARKRMERNVKNQLANNGFRSRTWRFGSKERVASMSGGAISEMGGSITMISPSVTEETIVNEENLALQSNKSSMEKV